MSNQGRDPQTGNPGEWSDDALARDFARTYPDLRWVEGWRRWMTCDGSRWIHDVTLHVPDRVRSYLRSKSDLQNQRRLGSAVRVAAIEKLARSDPSLAATVDQWDQDPWLLGIGGDSLGPLGSVDLRTGELAVSDKGHYITKRTSVPPEGQCPRWQTFLKEVMAGDLDMVAYLQRVVGYFLTGSTREHVLFFAYGTGRNGKSVFVSTICRVLGDYATVAPMETFTECHGDRHPTDLAGLLGARLVTANETEEGRRWNESRIKTMTGGDAISARFMRGDFFTYTPTFKLLIAGNHRPRIRNVDEAMRARLNLIPFTVTIPAEKRDPDLTEKLKAEWPGILAWAIGGCLEWQRIGLCAPESVRDATASYFESEDVFASWLRECCEVRSGAWDPPTKLFSSWKSYAEAARERIGRQAEFSERMVAAGFVQKKDARGRYWDGVCAISPAVSDADES